MSFQLEEMQRDLRAARLDGWLFYDFRGRDPIAHRILHLPIRARRRLAGEFSFPKSLRQEPPI